MTYVCVGRDPRDVSLSWEHHMANLDVAALLTARAEAVGLDDLAGMAPPPPPSDDPVERFWRWAETPFGFTDIVTLAGVLHHLGTFWDRRDDPNVHLVHYADLLADLPGETRRLAAALGIDVTDAQVDAYAEAATFDRMRERADLLAPNVNKAIWQSNESFFHRGSSGQWRHLLDDEGLRRYEKRVAELVPADLAAWAHDGRLSTATGPFGAGAPSAPS